MIQSAICTTVTSMPRSIEAVGRFESERAGADHNRMLGFAAASIIASVSATSR